jgi:hypothetical protein
MVYGFDDLPQTPVEPLENHQNIKGTYNYSIAYSN